MISTKFRVGKRIVSMAMDLDLPKGQVSTLNVDWAPNPPSRLSKKEWKEYRRGRDLFMQEVAVALGSKVAIVEI